MPLIRLQRFLSQAGIASRRHAEELITEGRVRVNGRVVTELGTKVDPQRDKVVVGGRRLQVEELVYVVMNKPKHSVTTLSDPQGRPTVADYLPKSLGARVFPVGRLDFDTEGVLFFTNDGDLAHALAHPSHRVPRVYHAKLKGRLEVPEIERLRQGVPIEGGRKAKAPNAHVIQESEVNTWLELDLAEGRTHEVKQMGDAIGHPVLKLIRVSFGGLRADGLRPGQTRPLSEAEIESLRKVAGTGSLRQAKRKRQSRGGERRG
jgi:23S rRNA pseudouridine2605 synthase